MYRGCSCFTYFTLIFLLLQMKKVARRQQQQRQEQHNKRLSQGKGQICIYIYIKCGGYLSICFDFIAACATKEIQPKHLHVRKFGLDKVWLFTVERRGKKASWLSLELVHIPTYDSVFSQAGRVFHNEQYVSEN